MSREPESLAPFFEEWAKEFSRAIEMFSGEKAGVSLAVPTPEDLTPERVATYSWWRQPFEGRGAFTVWAGVPEESWRALGTAMASEPDQAEAAFLEMLAQAQEGAAAVASAGLPRPVRCGKAEESEAPALKDLAVRCIGIEFHGATLPVMLLAIEPQAANVIGLEAEEEKLPVAGSRALARGPQGEPGSEMLDRLLEVNLPLSVALGRSVMPVRDILKMTPGALVELDRDIGEYVEILVNGTVVARGEVVSVKGNYGVRIKEIISREDRLALRHQA